MTWFWYRAVGTESLLKNKISPKPLQSNLHNQSRSRVFVVISSFLLLNFNVGATDFSSTLEQAAQADPRILSARALYQAKQAEAEGALAAYRPTLRSTGSLGNVANQDPLQREGSKRSFGLELEQPIPLFGRESSRVDLARVAVQVEAAELKWVERA
jgi:Outer membrane efflux protein